MGAHSLGDAVLSIQTEENCGRSPKNKKITTSIRLVQLGSFQSNGTLERVQSGPNIGNSDCAKEPKAKDRSSTPNLVVSA